MIQAKVYCRDGTNVENVYEDIEELIDDIRKFKDEFIIDSDAFGDTYIIPYHSIDNIQAREIAE